MDNTILEGMVNLKFIGEHYSEFSFSAKSCLWIALYKPKCQICQHFFGSMNGYWWEMLWNFLLWKKPFANHSLVQTQVLNRTTISWRHGKLNGYWWAFIWNFLFCRKLFANCLCTNSSVKFTSTFHGDIRSRLNGNRWALIWNHLLCRKLLDDYPCTNSIKCSILRIHRYLVIHFSVL